MPSLTELPSLRTVGAALLIGGALLAAHHAGWLARPRAPSDGPIDWTGHGGDHAHVPEAFRDLGKVRTTWR